MRVSVHIYACIWACMCVWVHNMENSNYIYAQMSAYVRTGTKYWRRTQILLFLFCLRTCIYRHTLNNRLHFRSVKKNAVLRIFKLQYSRCLIVFYNYIVLCTTMHVTFACSKLIWEGAKVVCSQSQKKQTSKAICQSMTALNCSKSKSDWWL